MDCIRSNRWPCNGSKKFADARRCFPVQYVEHGLVDDDCTEQALFGFNRVGRQNAHRATENAKLAIVVASSTPRPNLAESQTACRAGRSSLVLISSIAFKLRLGPPGRAALCICGGPCSVSPIRTPLGSKAERPAQPVPRFSKQVGNVRGTFWQVEADSNLSKVLEKPLFSGLGMVGATGIEPVTPTMSR